MARKAGSPMPTHPLDRLPEYVSGRLTGVESASVRAHLDGCAGCSGELRAWQAVSAAAGDAYSTAVASAPAGLAVGVVRAVTEAAGRTPDASARAGSIRGRLAWLLSFVAAQAPIVRREIWPASAVIMGIGAALSLLTRHGDGALTGEALAMLAPFAAVLGIATIYGSDSDPALELALSTPTSPRLVIVARLVLVLAWDLGLAIAASAILALVDGPAVFLPLVSVWLGPMLLLGCLSLLLSLFVHSSLAITVSLVIWAARALEITGESRLRDLSGLNVVLDAVWQTSPLTLVAAAMLLAVALAIAPYREPLSARPSL